MPRQWQNAAMLPPVPHLSPGPHLALVATSARSLVECAHADGYQAIALDVFGDVDTCRLATCCEPLGSAGLAMDREALLRALARLRARGDVAGWVAGSGFEAQLDLLDEAARLLPLLGNPPEVVRRVRDPGAFFAVLDALGITYPASSTALPRDPHGWLVKDAHACGGWHVRPLGALPDGTGPGRSSAGLHFQRAVAGEPWSCLFLAAAGDVTLVGFSRQIVRALGARPYVYRGGIGPLLPSPAVQAALRAAALGLTRAFGLVGLNGIDFVLDPGGRPWLLELNPRPTAATQLFAASGLMRAHLDACAGRPVAGLPACDAQVRGFETVFARRPGQVDASVSAWMESQAWCCDIPQPGTRHAWGDPLCTVRAEGDSAQAVQRDLAERRRAVLSRLQSPQENVFGCR